MKYLSMMALFVVGALAWRIGERLSAEAIAMAVGVLFGVLAGLPIALLIIATQRRDIPASTRSGNALPSPSAPPVIVLASGTRMDPLHDPQRRLSCSGSPTSQSKRLPPSQSRPNARNNAVRKDS